MLNGRPIVLSGIGSLQASMGDFTPYYQQGDRYGDSWAASTLGFITADVAILEPSDAAWPKWAVYGVAATVAAVYLNYYAGEGNANYPGPWNYTYEPPSQNPIHSPPNGFNPNEPSSGWNQGVKWLVAAKLMYEMYDEYNTTMNKLKTPAAPRDNTYIAPKIFPSRFK